MNQAEAIEQLAELTVDIGSKLMDLLAQDSEISNIQHANIITRLDRIERALSINPEQQPREGNEK